MSRQIDLIVIGDTPEGRAIVKQVASENPLVKIAFVSQTFRSSLTRDFLNVEYIKDEVIFIDYKNRLFSCYLKSAEQLYSTHLVIATGVTYEPFKVKGKIVPNVYNNLNDLPKYSHSNPAVVIGNSAADLKFALAVAKKYKQVYFCHDSIAIPEVTEALQARAAKSKNIVILPNTQVTKIYRNKDTQELTGIETSLYTRITCSAIYIKTAAVPATDFIPDKLIAKKDGYLIVNSSAESTRVPKCFAIGNCLQKSPARLQKVIINQLLDDFRDFKEEF